MSWVASSAHDTTCIHRHAETQGRSPETTGRSSSPLRVGPLHAAQHGPGHGARVSLHTHGPGLGELVTSRPLRLCQ